MISEEAGDFLLDTARDALHLFLQHRRIMDPPAKYPAELDAPAGVFVELYKHVPGTAAKELKGSAGVLDFGKSLIENTIGCALGAVNDQRFARMKLHELPVVDIEISVIGELQDITSRTLGDYMRKIEVGKDGLIVQKGVMKGVLMPKTPFLRKWTVRECLEHACLKAGLLRDSWADPAVEVQKFRPQKFKE